MTQIKITPLGSLGWIPARNRHTCCYSVEYREQLIIFDAGTGIVRFGEPAGAEILEKYGKVYLFLSHYHFDHVMGLHYLPPFFRDKEVHIAGPGRSIYNQSVAEILAAVTAPSFYSRSIDLFPMKIHIHDLEPGSNDIDGLKVETVLQEHSDPSLGIKIENEISYCTDTACTERTIDFAAGSRVLLHESWMDTEGYEHLKREAVTSEEARKAMQTHSHVDGVAELALKAKVGNLVLIHLNPSYEQERLDLMEKRAQSIFPSTFLAKEGAALVDKTQPK